VKVVIPNLLILGFWFPFNRIFPDLYLRRVGLPARAEMRRILEDQSVSKKSDVKENHDE
jgi:hypothetical protein